MDTYDWEEILAVEDVLPVQETAKQTRSKKRKWREIETVKDNNRLRKELEEYSEYRM